MKLGRSWLSFHFPGKSYLLVDSCIMNARLEVTYQSMSALPAYAEICLKTCKQRKTILDQCRQGKKPSKRAWPTPPYKQGPGEVNVVNLSSKSLSDTCVSTLSKGLSFVPTTTFNEFATYTDMTKFFLHLRLREYFTNCPEVITPANPLPVPTSARYAQLSTRNNEPHTDTLSSPPSDPPVEPSSTHFKAKSFFTPPKNRNSSLDTYCRLVERDLLTVFGKRKEYRVKQNFSKEQKEALMTTKNDKSLLIQSADKGGAIVVLKCDSYDNEISKQLSNSKFYRRPHSSIQTGSWFSGPITCGRGNK